MVHVAFRKWDGTPTYRFDAERLGRDEYGSWLGLPGPTPFVRPKGPGAWEHSFVILVPDDQWWVASFNDERDAKGVELYIDVTTAPEWDGEIVRMVDLDLDVVRKYDGRIHIKDQDEFEERRVAMGYPDDLVVQALTTAQSLLAAVKARREPFDTVGRRWLDKIT